MNVFIPQELWFHIADIVKQKISTRYKCKNFYNFIRTSSSLFYYYHKNDYKKFFSENYMKIRFHACGDLNIIPDFYYFATYILNIDNVSIRNNKTNINGQIKINKTFQKFVKLSPFKEDKYIILFTIKIYYDEENKFICCSINSTTMQYDFHNWCDIKNFFQKYLF